MQTQFHVTIHCMQCDNSGEFLTNVLRDFFANHGVSFRLSCPHTSPQNGKAERLIRTTNGIIRTLLLQAKLPPSFWVKALHTATHLLNLRPSRAIQFHTPHFHLYGVTPFVRSSTSLWVPLLPQPLCHHRPQPLTSLYMLRFPGVLMTHKYRGCIIVLSINKSVEPNEEQKVLMSSFDQGFTVNTSKQVFKGIW
jgi:hypothetical protein